MVTERNRFRARSQSTEECMCFDTVKQGNLITGERVEPSNYQWEMNLGNENGIWIRDSDPRQGAEDISGWRSNQLQLNKLRLPSTTISDESIYEVRCIASYNDTYNTSSHPFIINVRSKLIVMINFNNQIYKNQYKDCGDC
ncbi:unnamed protein product [Schistosoma mattheei]|uniref:Uncharacterized protein n=1 Tax=Schistosoma mattheei TaxID=31246 RepID=A0A183Q7P4_9TREM|nr:unnamed protein product [Schistosoma mattheei]